MHAVPAHARMQQLATRLARSPAKSLLLSTRPLFQTRAAAASAVQWLEQVTQQPSTDATVCTINLSRSCIRQADGLEQQARSRLGSASSSSSSSSSMSTVSSSTAGAATTAPASTIVLQEQQFHIPTEFAAPPKTSVPVHQLVALFSSFLGSPVLHKDARVGTMEAKWRLLQLLLMRHAQHEGQLADALDSLLQFALRVPAKKLSKVLANPLVPQPNKQMAQQQYAALWSSCHTAISDWVEAACSSAAFNTLQPAMAGLASSIDASVLLDDTLQTNKGVEAGKLMEAAAVQAVQHALPEGWTLLTSLHLVGVDGQVLPSSASKGCKFEVDMFVLNEQGVAVAIIEVKLAAANPLMALVNDVSNLLRLVDRTAGKALTCLTKDDATTAAAAAAAAVSRTSSSTGETAAMDPELQNKLTNMTARPPFAVGPSWHVLTIPVHPDILPVYVLGNDISEAAVTRGINSLVSSSTLKLLARSPAALAAALQDHLQQARCRPTAAADSGPSVAVGAPGAAASMISTSSVASFTSSSSSTASSSITNSRSSSSSSSSVLDDTVMGSFRSSELLDDSSSLSSLLLQQEEDALSPFATADLQQQQMSDDVSDCSSMQDFTPLDQAHQAAAGNVNCYRARIRAQLRLDAHQQQGLTEHIRGRLSTLQDRCRIYSLVKQLE